MMLQFTHESQPGRVIFGAGRRDRLADELARLGATRALVLSTPGQRGLAEWAAELLGERAVGIYAGAVLHVPVEAAAAARVEALRLGADSCVAIGGGSTIGLAKAIALELGLPIVAVPTTYAGSEMTPIWGLTEAGLKRTGRDPRVLPRSVIYDPELTLGLPPRVAGPSGINALAHCVEALYAPDASPIIGLIAEEGIRALAASLPAVVNTPGDLDARARALYGAWLAGMALGGAAMGLHHKLCHTLGGTFNLPHADTHTAVLPHAVAYNAPADPQAMARIARALGADDAAGGLFALAEETGVRRSLQQLGMREEDIDRAADLAVQNPYWNPRPVERGAVRELIARAWAGAAPLG
jgi:maleylacetate reductase